jgi:hypothetical protein
MFVCAPEKRSLAILKRAVYVSCRVCAMPCMCGLYHLHYVLYVMPGTNDRRLLECVLHLCTVQTEHYQYPYSYCTDLPIDLPMVPSSHRTTHLVCVTTEKYRGRSRRRHDVAVSVSMRVIWEWTVFRRSRDRLYVCPNEPSCVTPVSTRVFYHPRRRPRIRGFHLFPFLIRG